MLTFGHTRFQVRINYKSGNNITMWFTEFNYKKRGSETTVNWSVYGRGTNCLIIGVDDIESIWQMDQRLNVFTYIKLLINKLWPTKR